MSSKDMNAKCHLDIYRKTSIASSRSVQPIFQFTRHTGQPNQHIMYRGHTFDRYRLWKYLLPVFTVVVQCRDIVAPRNKALHSFTRGMKFESCTATELQYFAVGANGSVLCILDLWKPAGAHSVGHFDDFQLDHRSTFRFLELKGARSRWD